MNMEQVNRERGGRQGRDGIALVVVLGCLAVLTILAMGFAVVMRTERIASATYMQVAQARQLTQGALAHFMADVDAKVGNAVYPNWLTLKTPGTAALIVIPEAELYIPDSVFPTAAEKSAGWIPVTPATMRGQFSWVAFNVSGLLDANHAGGSPRGVGATPAELQLEGLPDIGNPAAFFGSRTSYKHFETVRELNALNPGGFTPPARSFTTFSYFPGPPARRGLVNPNNLHLDEADQVAILTTAFEGMQVVTWIPGEEEPSSTTITRPMAREVAKRILVDNFGELYKEKDMSDFETTLEDEFNHLRVNDGDFPEGMVTDDFVNKCKNLFSNRQQLYIVVLAGQILGETGDRVMADARALAMVWRDPFPDPLGQHDSFVHFFKWLDE